MRCSEYENRVLIVQRYRLGLVLSSATFHAVRCEDTGAVAVGGWREDVARLFDLAVVVWLADRGRPGRQQWCPRGRAAVLRRCCNLKSSIKCESYTSFLRIKQLNLAHKSFCTHFWKKAGSYRPYFKCTAAW